MSMQFSTQNVDTDTLCMIGIFSLVIQIMRILYDAQV